MLIFVLVYFRTFVSCVNFSGYNLAFIRISVIVFDVFQIVVVLQTSLVFDHPIASYFWYQSNIPRVLDMQFDTVFEL